MKVEHGVDANGRRTVTFYVRHPDDESLVVGRQLRWTKLTDGAGAGVAPDPNAPAKVTMHPGLTPRERLRLRAEMVRVADGAVDLARLESDAEANRLAADAIIVTELVAAGFSLQDPELPRRVDTIRYASPEPHAVAWRSGLYLRERLMMLAMWRVALLPDQGLPVDLSEVEVDEDVLEALQDAIARAVGERSENALGNAPSSPH
jgi:hypothetical protein